MIGKSLKVLWTLCAVAVLAVTLAHYEPGSASDIGIFLVSGMLFLAFPASLLVAGLVTLLVLLQEKMGIPFLDVVASNYVGLSIMWGAFFVVGYLQWFVLLPWLWWKWKAYRSPKNS